MIGEWLLTGSKLGFIAAGAVLTVIAVLGTALGVIGFVCWLIRGDDDEDKGKNDKTRPV